jgi:hypothetical protein
MDDSRAENKPKGTTDVERGPDFTRRALLRAGWLAPVVTTVSIPSAFAQSPVPGIPHSDHTDHVDVPHSDEHTDVPHTDTPHSDTPQPHTDHGDTPPHSDHADAPHQDHSDHQDAHADAHSDSHVDTHTDTHTDVPSPHSDVPHVDANQKP